LLELPEKIRDKKLRYQALSDRAIKFLKNSWNKKNVWYN
jgi:folate-dependent tRNA-U54 methylase TrmFO/GidA